jgi:hypothetical protein
MVFVALRITAEATNPDPVPDYHKSVEKLFYRGHEAHLLNGPSWFSFRAFNALGRERAPQQAGQAIFMDAWLEWKRGPFGQ